jgi:hypothetical protein
MLMVSTTLKGFYFANCVLYEVPTYLAGCPIETLNRKTKRKKSGGKNTINTNRRKVSKPCTNEIISLAQG